MGRIRQYIEVDNRNHWALFDSGARNTYVTKEVAENLPTFILQEQRPVALGGKLHNVSRSCNLQCKIKGYYVFSHARVLDTIGNDEDEKPIEILIGALLMQEWGIVLIPEKEDVDMSHYPKEFVEF